MQNSKESLEILIKNGASLDVISRDGLTPLMFAAANNNVDIMKILLRVNPKLDLDESCNNTYNALLFAAKSGFKEAVEFLILHGADINYEDEKGNTALMLAASKGQKEVVDFLTKKGAKK